MGIARRIIVAICLAASGLPMAVTPAFAAESLATRVQRLEDVKQIHDLLISYGRKLDGKDFHGYAELFSRDAVWIGGFGTHRTPAGIEAMLVKYMGPAAPGTRNKNSFHLLTNEIITVNGDRATAVSKLIFYTKGPDDKPVPQMAGYYDDEFIREDGQWKFLKRVAQGDIPYMDPLLTPPKE